MATRALRYDAAGEDIAERIVQREGNSRSGIVTYMVYS